ncbi:MAG TPA: bifunctional enoyl-CoA hydratase/phosphate acetyltransferase [Thermotogaceae bacterium]|nr:bifunctional enoyl-CoA hydratase/phosphate acetyltransferase [Thermotogaceae bacterium]
MIKKLSELLERAKGLKKILSVVVAEDPVVLKAVEQAKNLDIINPILVGSKKSIIEIIEELKLDLKDCEIVDSDTNEAVKKGVELVSEGKADFIMKGHIRTGDLMKVVLDKNMGLRTGRTLAMVSVFEIPNFDRLLVISDAGMIILPTLEQKVDIIHNILDVMKILGIENPKIALISAVEAINEKMPSTVEAAIISKMNERNQIKNCIVDGPFALDNVISMEAAKHKGIESPVAGKADALVMPNIEAGNVLYKALTFFMNAQSATTILGAKCPIVLTSRADSDETKLYSIALNALLINEMGS